MCVQRLQVLLFLSLFIGYGAGCLGGPPTAPAPDSPYRLLSADAPGPYEGRPLHNTAGREVRAPRQPVAADSHTAYGSEPLPGTSLTDSHGLAADADDPPKPARTGIEPDDFHLENIVKNAKALVGFGPDRDIAQRAFEKGEALFREGKYDQAAAEFQTAANRWPESAIEEDALFLLGECQFFTDRYFHAHDTYGKLLANHGNTRYLDTVMHRTFAIARYWDEQQRKSNTWPITPNVTDRTRPRFDTFGHAIEAYQRIRLHDPIGPLADHAVMAMANAYFVRGQFENAAWNYDVLRREYPKSRYQAEAHLLGLQAKKRIYQGSRYDGTPLEEADEIVEQALTLFPGELGEDKKRLQRSRAQIIEEQAQRDFDMGRFYETKRWYGAARFYYHLVLDRFPESRTAQQARERIAAIQDQPDEPPNYLERLTNLLPGGKR